MRRLRALIDGLPEDAALFRQLRAERSGRPAATPVADTGTPEQRRTTIAEKAAWFARL